MYHVELRQFPHNVWRFNLTDVELGAVVEPWVRERVLELGERKWSPHQAKLTIFEGPRIPLEQLTLGRGWRAVERQGENVTDAVLAAARRALEQAAHPPAGTSGSAVGDAALLDPPALGVPADLRSVASLLGDDPGRLLAAWREVAADAGGLSPSESLALAERQLER